MSLLVNEVSHVDLGRWLLHDDLSDDFLGLTTDRGFYALLPFIFLLYTPLSLSPLIRSIRLTLTIKLWFLLHSYEIL